MFRKIVSNSAVTPIISTMLILMIMFMAVGVLLAWGIPYIDRLKTESEYENFYSALDLWDDGLKDLIVEGVGSTRINNFAFDIGQINFYQTGRKFAVYYSDLDKVDVIIHSFTERSFKIKANNTFPPEVGFGIDRVQISWPNLEHDDQTFTINPLLSIGGEERTITIKDSDPDLSDEYRLKFFNSGSGRDHAHCWVYDLGYLRWDAYTSLGTYTIHSENNGVILHTPTQTYFRKGSIIYNSTNQLFLTASILRGRDGGGSGGSSYKVTTTLISSNVIEQGMDPLYNVTIYIDGEDTDQWTDFYEDYGFQNYSAHGFDTTYRYKDDLVRFTFLKAAFNCRISVGKGGI